VIGGGQMAAGNGFGVAFAGGRLWTADYERAELVPPATIIESDCRYRYFHSGLRRAQATRCSSQPKARSKTAMRAACSPSTR